MPGQLDAIHSGHVDVREDEVGRRRVQDVERFTPVLRLADDRKRQNRRAVVEQLAQPVSSRRFVVDDQDA